MKNLKAEMIRYGISVHDIQILLGCTDKTVRNKLEGKTEFTISEAMKIRASKFPTLDLEYLFASE